MKLSNHTTLYKRITLFVSLVLLLITADVFAGDVEISRASWDSEDSELIVKGSADRRTDVTIRNAESGAKIGQVRSSRRGNWTLRIELDRPPCKVRAEGPESDDERKVSNAGDNCDDGDSSGGADNGGGDNGGGGTSGKFAVLAANDLGMHCADLDYQVFSILPPYNVVHAQVIELGTGNSKPRIVDSTEADVFYRAASSSNDPFAAGSINTTSSNSGTAFKSNFWDNYYGFDAYDPLYPPTVLGMFPYIDDTGLPAPDVVELHLGGGNLMAHQATMPGVDAPYSGNALQPFHGYLEDFPFFTNFGFGYVAADLKRFTAEGIPILPVDDNGNSNPYPLMEVVAVAKNSDPELPENQMASVQTVLPVASEADCQGCHASQDVCDYAPELGLACSGIAAEFAETAFDVISDASTSPGDTRVQQVINSAKINILRLHDAKHSTNVESMQPVVCATCHFSPALDLAHLGPNNDNGKQQVGNISMSAAMHGHHGQYSDLFPDMPPPLDANGQKRDPVLTQNILNDTCYACHPGKRTSCLRGAMAKGGIVCQDCHGDMKQVGNDFTVSASGRVPWADEPGCQSCHTGDAVNSMAGASDVVTAPHDGIRLLQAYKVGDENAMPIKATNRRFAETTGADGKDHLYRLSTGHGGVMCEACHGSTHAIWPNPLANANDNITATQLQGHGGTLTECTVCHAEGSLGLTLDGPHGMHPVGDRTWNKDHKELSEKNAGSCKTCHGVNGEGTVLSRTATQRQWECKDEKGTLCGSEDQVITVAKETEVSCIQCHENKINAD